MTKSFEHRPPVLEDWGNWDEHISWEFWRTRQLAPEQYRLSTAAAFVAIWDLETRSIVTAFNGDRQHYEILGGHLKPGEDALTAAIREAREEGGVVIEPAEAVPFGYRQIANQQPSPAIARRNYPPVAYTPFFYAHVRRPLREPTGDDIVEARIATLEEMEEMVREREMQIGEFAIIKAGLATAYQDAVYGS
jgi:8-oxo-dGTP pyrophosphatase MutT (NUDIX family)